MIIRKAKKEDLPLINYIYNQSVQTKMSTADIDPVTIEERERWFKSHDEDHPVFVAEEKEQLIGWISLSAYRPGRRALRFTAEVSYYVHKDFQKKGIGSLLMAYTVENAPKYGIRTLFAILLENNSSSIKHLEKFNF
ncbi:MAG: GNAT family N-acetyltransferase [Bacteroidales bacterium]|nr:GNAT family N-acetyltransferase [Bacteroidales bacterium]